MNQNGGIHKGGFAVLCHRNGGSESPGILKYQIVEKIGLLKGYAWMWIAPLVTGTICFIMVIIVRKIPIARKLIP